MTKRILLSVLFTSLFAFSSFPRADDITVGNNDSIVTILTAQMGKRVTVNTKSGKELAGTVKSVSKELTHIAALSGKEFYDAVIVTKNIEAVIIRTK